MAVLHRIGEVADRLLVSAQEWIGGIIVGSTMLVITFHIVSRDFFGFASEVPEELGRIGWIWVYLLGSAVATRHRRHLRLDVLHWFVKSERNRQKIFWLTNDVLCLVMASYWLFELWKWFYWSHTMKERTLTLIFPITLETSAYLVCAVLVTIYFLVGSIRMGK